MAVPMLKSASTHEVSRDTASIPHEDPNTPVTWSTRDTRSPLLVNGTPFTPEDDIYEAKALHLAVISGDEALCRSLIAEGADINAKDGRGRLVALLS